MGYIIAMAGKGGSGKTTIAALMARIIKEKKLGSILVVDADPNSNMAETLGMESRESIGAILDEIAGHPEKIPAGMPKDRFIEYRLQTAITEGACDLLTMGRPEGAGCYCYVNNVLRGVMDKLIKDYDYVIIDNEAGLEHLSRRTTQRADALVIVSDATRIGLRSAKRISELAKDLRLKVRKEFLIINRMASDEIRQLIKELPKNYIGNIPFDAELEKISQNGSSLMALKDEAVSLTALRNLREWIWQGN